MDVSNDLYLLRHGIKGMKWGVRRFENYNGFLTPAGKRRYQRDNGQYIPIKKTKQTNKKILDKEKATKIAKNVAKGAAITAGVLAASYATKIASEEFASHIDYNKAKAITEDIMSENFTDLDKVSRNIIRDAITKSNYQTLNRQRYLQSQSNKSLRKNIKEAYLNPKTASVEKRNSLRENIRSNRYKIDMSVDMINKQNITKSDRGLRNYAESIVDPSLYEANRRKERQEAEVKYQAELDKRKRKAKEARSKLEQKLKEDSETATRTAQVSVVKHSDFLVHHGIKGMKWGVRRYQNADGTLNAAGKRRYAIQDARKYYKINRLQRAREHTNDEDISARLDKRIRKVQTRSDRKRADLSQRDINIGRQIVAKNRRNWAAFNTAAKAGLTAAGAYALYQNPKTRALVPLAVAGGAAATLGSAKKLPYYTMEARRYKQVNPKGSTEKGLSKRQKALRKAGKAALGAALAGATGYALYKTGAGEKLINAGKDALNSNNQNGSSIRSKAYAKVERTGEKVKNSSSDSKSHAKVKRTGENVATSAKERAKSSIRNQIMSDVDYNDPRTWIKGVNNTRQVVGTIKRYAQAAKAVKDKDYVTAASTIAPDISSAGNKIVDKGKEKVKKVKNRISKK